MKINLIRVLHSDYPVIIRTVVIVETSFSQNQSIIFLGSWWQWRLLHLQYLHEASDVLNVRVYDFGQVQSKDFQTENLILVGRVELESLTLPIIYQPEGQLSG